MQFPFGQFSFVDKLTSCRAEQLNVRLERIFCTLYQAYKAMNEMS